jgi:hypothetical protein
MRKLLNWFDENILYFLAGFLLVFIPLYPKWPLFDILPGYIVRVRLEDFLVFLAFILWLVQILRKKISFKLNLISKAIIVYLLIGFLSSLSAIFISKTVPLELIHVGKIFLHYLRRIEYMSLFFIFSTTITSNKQIKKLILIIGLTTIALVIYGFGQKYLQWPVYSTMNREFAKGWRLVLTPHARVPSTFAGHYDLAAYLMFFSTIFASLTIFITEKSLKKFFFAVFILSLILLNFTASRSSFIAYIIGITTSMVIFSKIKNPSWSITRYLFLIIISVFIMFSFGDLSERFSNLIKINLLSDYIKYNLLGFKKENYRYLNLTQDLSLVYSRSDQPPVKAEEKSQGKEPSSVQLPGDVYEDIPLPIQVEDVETAGEGKKFIITKRVYSPAAFTFGLSSAIRLDALWPMAIDGFLKNPILGSGYSTLNKEKFEHFSFAESTDNDYLRSLGETGILGFLSFYSILGLFIYLSLKNLRKLKDPLLIALLVGIIGGTFGMLVNAVYIDVFEASKVAFTFWALLGISVAIMDFNKGSLKKL